MHSVCPSSVSKENLSYCGVKTGGELIHDCIPLASSSLVVSSSKGLKADSIMAFNENSTTRHDQIYFRQINNLLRL